MDDKLLTPKEAGTYLGIGVSGLNKRRMRGEGPPFVKMSPGPRGRIRYREADLRAFVGARVQAQ